MTLGEKLNHLRKKEGLSQEEAAEKLNVTRQTISKWETDQSIPVLNKAKALCELYKVRLDYFLDEKSQCSDITLLESLSETIDWTSAWSKKYPILSTYPKIEGIGKYEEKIAVLFNTMMQEYDLNEQDTVLILKDILYHQFLKEKKRKEDKE